VAELFAAMEADSPLIVPLPALAPDDWTGVECPSVRAAVWMMRMMVARNILARREDTTLMVPVNPEQDPGGHRTAAAVSRIRRLAESKGIR
jgi:hypothetical protein